MGPHTFLSMAESVNLYSSSLFAVLESKYCWESQLRVTGASRNSDYIMSKEGITNE